MGIFNKVLGKKQKSPVGIPNLKDTEKDQMIEFYDVYGRKMFVSKDSWKKSVLPDQLKKNWNSPDNLYNDILLCINDGFLDEITEAAKHLKDIDSNMERGYTILSIVYLKKQMLDEAEIVLTEFIKLQGKTATILTNLAKVYFARKDESKSLELLWEGLCLDPNQENALPWWAAIQFEKGGKQQYYDSLLKASQISGSWLPQIYLARVHLENKEIDKAMQLYNYIFTFAIDEASVLYVVSGDLGKNGYLNEIIENVVPLYNFEKHDLRAGLNILQAYLQTKNIIDGQILLNKILQLNRPDLKDYLMNISNEFEKLKELRNVQNVIPKEVEYELVLLDKPIWYYGLKSPDWLLQQAIVNKKIGLLVFTNVLNNNEIEPKIQREDDIGRFTRSIPLLIGEDILFKLNISTVYLLPIAKDLGPVVSGAEYEISYLAEIAYKQELDYIITGSIADNETHYDLKIVMFEGQNSSSQVIKRKILKNNFGMDFSYIKQDIIENLSKKINGYGFVNAKYYKSPSLELTLEYLGAFGQSLMQSLVVNNLVPVESIWGERNILNWYMNLALSDIDNPIPKIMLISGLSKSKSYGSEIYKEFKAQAISLLLNEQSESSNAKKLLPFVYRLFDMENEFNSLKEKLLENNNDNSQYEEWLLSL